MRTEAAVEATAEYRIRSHSLDAFLAHEKTEWWALHRSDPAATPFQRPDWIESWWSCFRDEYDEARVLVAYRTGERTPAAILPLVIRREDDHVVASCAGEGLSDYCGWIAHPRVEAASLLDRFLAHLTSEGITRLRTRDLRTGGSMRRAVLDRTETRAVEGDECPVAVFPSSWTDYWGGRSRNLRQSVARASRRLTDAETTFNAAPNPSEIDSFVELHLAWWRARDRESLLEFPRVRAFVSAAARALSDTGGLAFSSLRHGTATAATFLLLADDTTRYYYQSAIDPDSAHLQPGLLHMTDVARLTLAAGYARLDLLRGSERYKCQFATELPRNLTATLALVA